MFGLSSVKTAPRDEEMMRLVPSSQVPQMAIISISLMHNERERASLSILLLAITKAEQSN